MANLNQSLKEAVCIDEEIFFGPVTDKERKIREQFENACKNENQSSDSQKVFENDTSKNDSLYKSFSVDDTKYDSFEDSLNEEIDKMSCEAKHVTLRKSFDKLKSKRHGFYDSLEDVCSLISNIDKCSISCGVENDSNFNNKQHIIEDSLKNPPVAVPNKNLVSEQVHFDDDSLAIIEYENTFDDSLEEVNVLESIEIEEIDDIENVIVENQNIAIKVEQNPVCAPRNLFDTSVQIICEKMKDSDADPEESSDDKNLLYDSLSNSDFKDILKDSLEESEKLSENLNLLKQSSDVTSFNVVNPENMYISQSAHDTSVQIIYENSHNFNYTENISEKTNSEYNDISKDSLENSKNAHKDFAEQLKIKNTSEQNLQSSSKNTVPSKDVFASRKSSKNSSLCAENNAFCSDSSQVNKLVQDCSINTESVIPIPASDDSSLNKETISVDSCHLKILNDNINIDEDLKFQLHIEVTVGDKKCQISSQDIKLMQANLNSKSEIGSGSLIPGEGSLTSPIQCIAKSVNEEEVPDPSHCSNPELNCKTERCKISGDNTCEINSSENSNKKSKITESSTISQRSKPPTSQLFDYSEGKLNSPQNLSEVSLLQALDLHDISIPFINESIIQSEDSLMPLNLYSKDQYIQNFHTPVCRNESKENVPEPLDHFENKKLCASDKKVSPNKLLKSKTPNTLQKCSSFKETTKKTPGTKIPVRKLENFAIPVAASNKFMKQTLSAEKVKKCHHSPHSVDGGKKTLGTTPNKPPHFCKVRNTIFSKVPQIVPSKKYVNIQSPVAQYIKNNGPMKSPGFDPVLRDCMNLPMESPYHSHQTPKSGSLKSTKKKKLKCIY